MLEDGISGGDFYEEHGAIIDYENNVISSKYFVIKMLTKLELKLSLKANKLDNRFCDENNGDFDACASRSKNCVELFSEENSDREEIGDVVHFRRYRRNLLYELLSALEE